MALLQRAEAEEVGRGAADELAEALRRAWVDVDLDALAGNLARLRRLVEPSGVVAVLKADAYGHGARRVARLLEEEKVDWGAVALVEEGAELRRGGVELPLLVLGPAHGEQLPLFSHYRLVPAVSGLDQVEMWCAWSRSSGVPQVVHLKVDTGMSRLGVSLDELPEALRRIRHEPGLLLGGFLSHFADAEDLESPHSAAQEERFAGALELLEEGERQRVLVHMSNSAGALHRPASRFQLVRLGLSLYGYDPAARRRDLAPVMSVRGRLVSRRRVPAGTRLSYGGRHVTERESVIGVLPVGYADGYPWRLGNRGQALVGGRRVPVVGRVTMDMTLLDITETAARAGDEAVLLGSQGSELIDAGELAQRAGTIPYEILCGLGQRLPRRYFRGGELEAVVSPLVRRVGG